jgi:hypothetical protein
MDIGSNWRIGDLAVVGFTQVCQGCRSGSHTQVVFFVFGWVFVQRYLLKDYEVMLDHLAVLLRTAPGHACAACVCSDVRAVMHHV